MVAVLSGIPLSFAPVSFSRIELAVKLWEEDRFMTTTFNFLL